MGSSEDRRLQERAYHGKKFYELFVLPNFLQKGFSEEEEELYLIFLNSNNNHYSEESQSYTLVKPFLLWAFFEVSIQRMLTTLKYITIQIIIPFYLLWYLGLFSIIYNSLKRVQYIGKDD